MEIAFTLLCIGLMFLLYFLMREIDPKYFYVQLFIVGFILLLGIIITGYFVAYQDCEIVINSTEELYEYGDNYNSYHYDDYNESAPPQLNELNLFHKDTTYTYSEVCTSKNLASRLSLFQLWFRIIQILSIGVLLSPIIYGVWYFRQKQRGLNPKFNK